MYEEMSIDADIVEGLVCTEYCIERSDFPEHASIGEESK